MGLPAERDTAGTVARLAAESQVHQGLSAVLSQVAVGHGYLEAMAGLLREAGPFARAEAGYRLTSSAALFGYGEASRQDSGAGVGVRWNW